MSDQTIPFRNKTLVKSYNVYNLSDIPKVLSDGLVNDIDSEGRTIVFTVCRIGCLETLKLCIENGADLSLKDHDGSSILMVACGVGHLLLAEYLVNTMKMDITEFNNRYQTCLMVACKCGRLDIVKFLVNKFFEMSMLLEVNEREEYINSNINCVDEIGYSCLMWALSRKNLHVMKFLVTIKGIDLNVCDIGGKTPLMFACKAEYTDAIILLVEAGANLNESSNSNRQCLFYALERGPKNIEMIKYLLKKGALTTIFPGGIKQCTEIVNLVNEYGALV